MKVLVIAETIGEKSGWGRYASNIIRETKKQGLVCVSLSPPQLLPVSFFNLFRNILTIRKFINGGVKVIHAYDCWPFAVYASLASIGKRVNIFITGVGTYSVPPKGRPIKSFLMRYSYRKAKEVFCISNYSRMRIKERSEGNFSIVFWGTTELPEIGESVAKKYKEDFKIREGTFPIILTVGEIKNRKGQLNTLKAIQILKKNYPSILYVTLGSTAKNGYVSAMRAYAENNGLSDNFKVVDDCKTDTCLSFFYSTCDLFVMNSNNEGDHFEGFGLVFLEVAQFGKPAVGSSGCGIEDAIVDGVTGSLSKQGDEEDIAKKIDFVLDNVGPMGKAARERAKEFSWEKTVNRHLRSYNS